MIEKNKSIDILKNIDELLEISDVTLTVTGTSMWPFFCSDKTKVKLTKIKQIKKGRSYLFLNNNNYVLHRLIKINNNTLTLKGDGNVKKEIIKEESLIAELVSFNNKKGKEIFTINKIYRLKVFLYRLLPRRVVLKLFKRK